MRQTEYSHQSVREVSKVNIERRIIEKIGIEISAEEIEGFATK